MPPKTATSKLEKVLSKKNKKRKEEVDASVSSSEDSSDDEPDEWGAFKAVVTPAMVRSDLVLCKNKNNNGRIIVKGEPYWKKGSVKPTDSDPLLCMPVISVVLPKLLTGEIRLAQEVGLAAGTRDHYAEMNDLAAKDKKYFVRDNVLHCTMRTVLEMELFEAPPKDTGKLKAPVPFSFFTPRFEQKYEFNESGFVYACTYKTESWEATGLGVCHKKRKVELDVTDSDEEDDKKEKEKMKKKKESKLCKNPVKRRLKEKAKSLAKLQQPSTTPVPAKTEAASVKEQPTKEAAPTPMEALKKKIKTSFRLKKDKDAKETK